MKRGKRICNTLKDVRIQFTNGSVTEYVYSATGQKLGVEYRVAAPNTTVTFGVEPDALTLGQTVYAGSTQYLLGGSLVMRDGMIDKCLFDGGYAKASAANPTTYSFSFRYYNCDHLGNNREVVDSAGVVVQVTNYYPSGVPYTEAAAVMNANMQPYKFNGKELDGETGLYYYGARYYDPKLSVWYSTDPMEVDYPWVSTYGYCLNNPIKLYDINGEDWYQDEDGTIQYNPNVHSKNDLNNSQKYLGTSHQNKQHTIFYRNDGSILFKKETDAYNRIWNQANVHYRNKGEKGGREVGAYVLSNGNVLVMPDYLNDNSTAKFDIAGYKLVGQKLYKNNAFCYDIIGQIHTHQDKSLPATPSYYTGDGYGDLGVSLFHNSLPVFTIGHDGKIHGIRSYRNSKGAVIGMTVSLSSKDASMYNLLNGVTSLYSIILRLPKIANK